MQPFNVPMCWQPAKLIKLPHSYDTLFEMYIAAKCTRCEKVRRIVFFYVAFSKILYIYIQWCTINVEISIHCKMVNVITKQSNEKCRNVFFL